MKEQIEEFIKRRFPIDCNWMSGNCYHFAVILNSVFNLPIAYLPIEGHFVVVEITDDEVYFYDYLGQRAMHGEPVLYLQEIEETDPVWYQRIIEDCIKYLYNLLFYYIIKYI